MEEHFGTTLAQQGAEPDLRIYAVVHRREVVVLTFAALGEGGILRPFCLDVLVPVQRVQGAEERTRTADLLITSALLHMPRYTSLSGKGAQTSQSCVSTENSSSPNTPVYRPHCR